MPDAQCPRPLCVIHMHACTHARPHTCGCCHLQSKAHHGEVAEGCCAGRQIHFEGLKEGRLISKFVATFTLDPPPGTPSQPTAKSAAPVAQEESQKWDAFSRSIYASACPSLAIPIFQPGPLRAPACECDTAVALHPPASCLKACNERGLQHYNFASPCSSSWRSTV